VAISYRPAMPERDPFKPFRSSPEIIRLAAMTSLRLPLRNVEGRMHERGIDVSHETIQRGRNRCGAMFGSEIRRRRAETPRTGSQGLWRADGVFEKVDGERRCMSRAADHEGKVPEGVIGRKKLGPCAGNAA